MPIQRLDPRYPQPVPHMQSRQIPGNPPQALMHPHDPRLVHAMSRMLPGQGMGDVPGQEDAFGLPPQDLINALYDIFGSYPRKNVLPYANSFNLLASEGNRLAANGTARPSIKISADASLVVTAITGVSTGDYSVFMRTDSSDRQLMQFPIHSSAMVGTAERPFFLPKPLLLAQNTTTSFDITDLSGAGNDVWFTLWGFKIYRRMYAAAG